MPFQDIDEVAAEPSRQPSGVERILRKIFVEDWSLKLLSLAITLVLWLIVTGQNEPVTTHVNVQLNFVRPQALEISNDPPKTIDVTLTGSRIKLDNLRGPDLVATIDITDQRAGERMLRLADKVQLTVPQGVKIVGFLPAAIPIRLEPIVEKELKTEPRYEGNPADGYEVYSVTANHGSVTVRGPADHVNLLEKAPTETVWLTGQKESFTATNVAIDIPDPKVDLLDPAVDLQIEIGERRIEKSFPDVPVQGPPGIQVLPRTAAVIVLGPARMLDGLKNEDIRIVLNTEMEPHLELTTGVQSKVVLKSTNPIKFNRLK
ncbi:MAG TPA: CdaR family protein [Pyrinomonadaceae bacterium]|jgi:YbbR domain-containing protein|nr:CdaR family protein [Pyrinomonadaceae bacterium]